MTEAWYGDFTPEERLRTLLALLRKDLRRVWILWLVTLFIAAIILFILYPVASQAAYYYPYSVFRWYEGNLSLIYALAVGLNAIFVGVGFLSLFGDEVRLGTVKSLILHPLDLNDLTLSKLVGAFIGGGVNAAIAFLVPALPFFGFGIASGWDFLLIDLIALGAISTAVLFGAFLAHLLMAAFRSYKSPAGYGGLIVLLSLLTTRMIAFAILMTMASAIFIQPTTPYDQRLLLQSNVEGVADAVAWMSPVHVGGQMLAAAFGLSPRGIDVWLVLPLFFLISVAGFLAGRRVYLDVFFR